LHDLEDKQNSIPTPTVANFKVDFDCSEKEIYFDYVIKSLIVVFRSLIIPLPVVIID